MSETPIADEIRAEAVISTRPGQADRLAGLAHRVAQLERGGKTLGEMVAFWQNLAVEVTGSQDCIGPNGDGDWDAITERLMELPAMTWDQGYRAGFSNAMRRMSDEPKAPISRNPYKADQ